MKLSTVLRSELVTTDLRAADRDAALRGIADVLAARDVVADADAVHAALVAREEAHSTAMGNGMAIPHCTVSELDDPVLMVATSPEPVPFGVVAGEAEGADGVRIFFVLLSPPGRQGDHIKLLARICRLARHGGLLTEILEARTPDGVSEAILRVDGEHV